LRDHSGRQDQADSLHRQSGGGQNDRDRDVESPQHVSECHAESAVPGYVDYGINHGATLMVDIEDGRFVFFYLPVIL
jgi:hypothetical protein